MAHLLVVEDHPKLLQSLRRGLEEEGHSVLTAQNGDDGFRFARDEPVDAVVLDLMLPGRDGLQVLRDLRGVGFTRPILVVTARDAVNDRVVGLDSGADDYLVKPFAFSELLARLRAALRRDLAARDLRLRCGDLELDLVTRSVTRGGQTLDLTTRQFEVLKYLMQHAGEVITRDMLSRDVWKDGTGIMTNVIEVYINQLRRKLERADWPALLHTVRGSGYMLRAAP